MTTKHSSLSELRRSNNETREFFTSLDYVKQFILYHDFKGGRTLTFDKQILENNRAHLSLFLLEFVMFFINFESVVFRYGGSFFRIPKEYNIVSDDPSWKECELFAQRIHQDNYRHSINKSLLTVREIKALFEELKKRNLVIK